MNSVDQFRLPCEVSAAMSAYARLVDEKLPGRICGLYLVGSLALDDYRPGQSDIDFVAVSDTALKPSELGQLRRVHTALRRALPGPKLDGVYVTWPALAAEPVGASVPYCQHGRFEFNGGFASLARRERFERGRGEGIIAAGERLSYNRTLLAHRH